MSERDKTPISSRRRALSMTSLALIVVGLVSYSLWTPGADLRDGRHNLGRNALWLGHGWLGDDGWFKRHKKEGQEPAFRDPKRIEALAVRLSTHQITDVYPHLCPTLYDGHVARVDPVQVERFLDGMAGVRVIPWVGGAWGNQASPEDPAWRRRFAASIAALMAAHPRLAGVHINIEPVPEGSEAFLVISQDQGRHEGVLQGAEASSNGCGWVLIEQRGVGDGGRLRTQGIQGWDAGERRAHPPHDASYGFREAPEPIRVEPVIHSLSGRLTRPESSPASRRAARASSNPGS